MAPEIEREEAEAKDAQDFLQMLEQTYADAGAKLKRARVRSGPRPARHVRAQQQREAAERRAEAARQAAGLASATSGLSVALKSMQDAAARDLASADAASAKARLLKPTKPEEDDPNIAEALRLASGKEPRRPTFPTVWPRSAAVSKAGGGGAAEIIPPPFPKHDISGLTHTFV